MIDAATLAAVKERVDIYAVVSRHIDLTKNGSTWRGLCPFHSEKTPSFTVTPGRGTFHCFGCGQHGDAIEFLQRHLGVAFGEAVEQLAALVGVQVGRDKAVAPPRFQAKFTPPKARPSETVPIGREAQAPLERWRGQIGGAGAYLAARRIPLEVAQAFGAGFLPAGESAAAGFSGPRIVFPHTVPGGEIVNLYGRSTDPQASKAERHRHLPQPKGLLNAQALELDGPLWIVEGAFDALALRAAGVDKVVAVFGLEGFDWAWLRGQREVFIALDADESGRKAAEKLREEARYRGLKVTILDPAAYGGHKDIAEAWEAHALVLPGVAASDPHADLKALIRGIGGPLDRDLEKTWPTFKALAERFATLYLDAALACGWTLEELFALPTNRAGLDGGALWSVSSFRVERFEVSPDALVAVTEEGSRLVHRRGSVPPGPLPWST